MLRNPCGSLEGEEEGIGNWDRKWVSKKWLLVRGYTV